MAREVFELSSELRAHFPLTKEGFQQLLNLEGRALREVRTRRTLAFRRGGRGYFIKIHRGCGWTEILKNLASFRAPVTGADQEWRGIERLSALGVPTMTLAGKGMRGRWPDRIDSFVITDEVAGAISLAELIHQWDRFLPDQQARLRRYFAHQLGRIAGTMHRGGVNHRDFYLCHFLVKDREWHLWQATDPAVPVLIDLHRVQIRHRVPRRWLIKDLGALMYSAFEADPSSVDVMRFIRAYLGEGWRDRYIKERKFWYQVLTRALAFQREWNKMQAI